MIANCIMRDADDYAGKRLNFINRGRSNKFSVNKPKWLLELRVALELGVLSAIERVAIALKDKDISREDILTDLELIDKDIGNLKGISKEVIRKVSLQNVRKVQLKSKNAIVILAKCRVEGEKMGVQELYRYIDEDKELIDSDIILGELHIKMVRLNEIICKLVGTKRSIHVEDFIYGTFHT